MKKVTCCFISCLVVLVLCPGIGYAQFTGKVCYVTPSSATTFPASSYSNADDVLMINKLTSWGFTVDVAIGGSATATGSFNNTATPTPSDSVLLAGYKLVFYSEFMSSGNGFRVRGLPVAGPYTPIKLPVVSLDNWFVRYSSAGFLNSSTNSNTTFNNTTANSVDFNDNAVTKFSDGFTGKKGVVLCSATTESAGNFLNFAVLPAVTGQTIVPIATVAGTTDQMIAWGAEPGTLLYNNAGVLQSTVSLTKRYAAVGIMGPAYMGLTADGFNLIKNAISWALTTPGTSVGRSESMPSNYSLNQNYPNPFNPSTEISFTLPKEGMTTLSVFNVLGQKVATLVNLNLDAGTHQYTFDASRMTSGVYFYRLESGSFSSVKKMLLVK